MLSWFLSGGAIPAMLTVCGVFFSLYLKGLPLCRPGRMWRAVTTPAPGGGVSPFRAVTLALAGTLGVGNIVGVANAIFVGGAGAVFWMWVSALLAMILKYAEILLAVRHRRQGRDGSFYGGAVYYIRDYFQGRGRWRTAAVLSCLFAGLMILNAMSMGCVIQVNAVSMAFRGVWGISPWFSGVLLLVLTLPVLVRGTKGISGLTELLVPIMTGGYLILSLAVLILRRDAVGDAFSSIFTNALDWRSVGGGVMGFLTSKALRVGTMRGLLSNEAGCGTAPTAHAAADASSPASQGVWGILEVFVDTVLLCTVTALVILVSAGEVWHLGENGVMMALGAYACVLGDWASCFLAAAIFCFGYATVLCWAGYGMESLRAVSGKKRWRILYLAAFGCCTVLGAVIAPEQVWWLSDFAITALTTVNLWMLVLMRREIRAESFRWGGLEKNAKHATTGVKKGEKGGGEQIDKGGGL
ncbi:MAG: sodium:alanine symporter family protein [Clostridia bacterium]|nr:sodium:alanine symporter family protein [Clostridia bacterium]